jgi:hypothetical protein
VFEFQSSLQTGYNMRTLFSVLSLILALIAFHTSLSKADEDEEQFVDTPVAAQCESSASLAQIVESLKNDLRSK